MARGTIHWSAEEEAALTDAITKYGVGKWCVILGDPQFSNVLKARTNVALKKTSRHQYESAALTIAQTAAPALVQKSLEDGVSDKPTVRGSGEGGETSEMYLVVFTFIDIAVLGDNWTSWNQDMIGVIEDVHPRANYNKDGEDKSHVALTITNGRYVKPEFYIMNMVEEDDCIEVPTIKVNELIKLNESFVLKKVIFQVTVKKFDEKMNWYTLFCLKCEKDLKLVDEVYSCCGRSVPYPDISDATGCVPIVWPDDEVTRILGRTVYEVDADHTKVKGLKVIPDILRTLEKKKYNITIDLTDKNLKEGSKVFCATYISEPVEITDNYSPSQKQPVELQQTVLTNVTDKQGPSNNFSPPTMVSMNRTRPRLNVEPLQYNQDHQDKQPNFKNIKIEKMIDLDSDMCLMKHKSEAFEKFKEYKCLPKSVPQTSYEIWKERKPSLKHVKIWGCPAYVKHATFLEKEFILEGNSGSKIELDEVQEAQTTTDQVETPILTEQPFVEQPIRRSGRVSRQPER
ncbi:hypothetical protein AgCh_015631 [Apium graveolens]